jgi:hypothetical protein
MGTTRREFFGAASLAGAMPAAPEVSAPWFDRPMRWIQVAFVEDDPGHYKPDFWLDYFRRIHADAACLSAGGCVAFYPTKVPLHYRSKFLIEGSDPFGELVAGCRKQGMNVVGRIDPHATHQEMYDAHPDWIAMDAQGRPRRHWAAPEYWVTCGLGPYNFEFMTEVIREIVSRYRVDGIFGNRWSGSGMCYCGNCQRNFRTFSGLDLPRTPDPQDPARREYIRWRNQRLIDLWKLWDMVIKAMNPNAAMIPNTGGGALSELDMKAVGEMAPTLFADRQARRGVMPPWANGKNGKEYRATLGSKPIAGLFSIGLEEPYRWKDSVQAETEIRVWAADGIAHGLRPWVIKFNAKPLDERWLAPVEQLFVWHAKNEKYLRNERPLARVAMVYSQQTAQFYGGEQARSKVEDATLGLYHALVEARVPFEMVHDRLLDEEHLRAYRTLVLPNIAALSDAQCAQLRRFVEAGGGLVATHETSLYDEWGVRRSDFGLADLFGISFGGRIIGPQQNAYLNLVDRADPLLAGLASAGRIINGVNRIEIKPPGSAQGAWPKSPLTVVPSYPDLPMEEVYPRIGSTQTPGVLVRRVGAGRVVYFPWDIDRTFWEVLSPDHGILLANAVRWATNEPQPLEVKGPGVVDVSMWQQRQSVTVHLVNLTNPMMMKGPFREIIPVGPQRIRVRLPTGAKGGAVKALVSGQKLQWREESNWIELTTPPIGLHEVIAIDLA